MDLIYKLIGEDGLDRLRLRSEMIVKFTIDNLKELEQAMKGALKNG